MLRTLELILRRMNNVFIHRNDDGQILASDHFASNVENEPKKGEIER